MGGYYRPTDYGSRIVDLMQQRGQIQAQGAARSGEIWGNALGNIGQLAGQYGAQYAEQQKEKQAVAQMAKRDAAIAQFVESWDGQDPKFLLSGLTKIAGPEGRKMASDVLAFQQLSSKAEDLKTEKNREVFNQSLKSFAQMPYPLFERWYGGIREKMAGPASAYLGIKPEDIPEGPTPEFHAQIQSLVRGPEEEYTLGEGQVRMRGGQQIAAGPAKPEKAETRSLDVQAAEALAKGDTATYNRLLRVKREMGQADDRSMARAIQIDPNVATDEAKLLLTGGTADKIPIKGRAAAVEAAKASGGVDGTGFVPMSNVQQTKYNDLMDLRTRAIRLRTLLNQSGKGKDEPGSSTGPIMGRLVDFTREMPLIGQDTDTKEAFDLFGDLSDRELRKRTGAAASAKEYDRILGFGVSHLKQKDSNLTNLNRIIETLDGSLKNLGVVRFPGEPAEAEGQRPPVRVSSPEEAMKLPKGTPIILPDGSPGVVP